MRGVSHLHNLSKYKHHRIFIDDHDVTIIPILTIRLPLEVAGGTTVSGLGDLG